MYEGEKGHVISTSIYVGRESFPEIYYTVLHSDPHPLGTPGMPGVAMLWLSIQYEAHLVFRNTSPIVKKYII